MSNSAFRSSLACSFRTFDRGRENVSGTISRRVAAYSFTTPNPDVANRKFLSIKRVSAYTIGMEVTRGLLKNATDNGLITELQADHLWKFLTERGQDIPGFRFTHILYYLGGLIAIGAMSLFMTLGWERFGGWGLFFIALAYAGAGLWLTEFLLNRSRLPIP